jgi:hypothetical protein
MAVQQSEEAVTAFEGLERMATKLQATLLGASMHFTTEQGEASATMTNTINGIRTQAYTSCALMTPVPAAALVCAAAAAAIVEGDRIPVLKAKLAELSDMMNGFQAAFGTFAQVAAGYQSTAQKSVVALDEYIAVAVSSEIFVEATSDINVAVVLITEYNVVLKDIFAATQALIDKIPAA